MTVKIREKISKEVTFTDINGKCHEIDLLNISQVGYSNNEKGYYIELQPSEDRLTLDKDTFKALIRLIEIEGNEDNESL